MHRSPTSPSQSSTTTATVVFESEDAHPPERHQWGRPMSTAGQAGSPADFLWDQQPAEPPRRRQPDGSDIFFTYRGEPDPRGQDSGLRALYDARINGGFPEPAQTDPPDCQDDACQTDPTPPPADDQAPAATTPGNFPGNTTDDGALPRCEKLEDKGDPPLPSRPSS